MRITPTNEAPPETVTPVAASPSVRESCKHTMAGHLSDMWNCEQIYMSYRGVKSIHVCILQQKLVIKNINSKDLSIESDKRPSCLEICGNIEEEVSNVQKKLWAELETRAVWYCGIPILEVRSVVTESFLFCW